MKKDLISHLQNIIDGKIVKIEDNRNKNVNNLMKYAKIMGIEDEVFSLMEILLNED